MICLSDLLLDQVNQMDDAIIPFSIVRFPLWHNYKVPQGERAGNSPLSIFRFKFHITRFLKTNHLQSLNSITAYPFNFYINA